MNIGATDESFSTVRRFKTYPAYKDSGIEWIGQIPSTWEMRRLRLLVREPLEYGANESAELIDPESPRYIRITDIAEDGSLRDDTFRSLPSEIAEPFLLRSGDVLFARSGATVGKSFLYRESWGEACYAGYLIRARLNEAAMDARYLSYFTNSVSYKTWLSAALIQATIQNVSAEKYGNLVLTLPPKEDQHLITSFLDRETAKLDALIAKKERLIELLQENRTTIITHAVTKGLDPNAPMKDSGVEWLRKIPAHWDVRAVWTLFSLGRGRVISHEEIHEHQGTYPVYSSQTENDGVMGYIDTYDFDGEYLTWTTDGARAGTVFSRHGQFNCTNVCGTLKARSESQLDNRFVRDALNIATSWFVRHDINPKLMNNVMARIRVPTPSQPEQRKIADFLEVETAKIDALIDAVREGVSLPQEYRTALISAAVTGKIDVRDEAASDTGS